MKILAWNSDILPCSRAWSCIGEDPRRDCAVSRREPNHWPGRTSPTAANHPSRVGSNAVDYRFLNRQWVASRWAVLGFLSFIDVVGSLCVSDSMGLEHGIRRDYDRESRRNRHGQTWVFYAIRTIVRNYPYCI